jgi:dolichol-phosphate mannosyltransferase
MSESSTAGARVLVVIPTYNECDNIERIVAGVRSAAPQAHILVADDSSPDGTGDLADSLAAADPQVHVLHRPGKAGLGAAYLDGFGWGLRQGYDVLVEMDADGSHRAQDLPRLLSALEAQPEVGLVLGSRWVPGGAVVNWPISRQVLSRGGNAYTRLLTGLPVQDATGGFRAFRASTLRALDLEGVRSQGYCFQVDMVRRVAHAGIRIAEVPITFVEREFGTSKMSGRIVREALLRVTLWGIGDRLRVVRRASTGSIRPNGAPAVQHLHASNEPR